jgi:REP element-mobilizing transposase RayT
MSKKYQNKYRIETTRLKNWNYGWNAFYYITIVTKNRKYLFGEIIDGTMKLSEIGKIVQNEWLKTFDIRQDMNLKMGIFVIMPNHFHAIIGIGKNKYNTCYGDASVTITGDAKHCVSTDKNDMKNINQPKNQFGSQSKNLASIIRGFKSAVTTKSLKILPNFAWQSRFHDHIIRNENEYIRIYEYIKRNPEKWERNRDNDYK